MIFLPILRTDRARPVRNRKKSTAENDSTPAPVQQTIDDDPELLRAVEQGELQGGSLDFNTDTAHEESQISTSLNDRMELDFEQPIPILFDQGTLTRCG